MRWKYKLFVLLLALAVLAVIFHRPILTAAGESLKVGCEAPERSEVIIVLGGELDGERTRKAAELYKQGLAPKVMLSDGTMMSWRTAAIEEMYDLAVLEGVDEEDLIREEMSRSTYENAVYTKEIMSTLGLASALVVTSDWHGKRTQYIFNKVYEGTGIELHYCGTPDGRSDFTEWWSDGEKQQVVLTEWAKRIVYWLRYR